MTARAVKVTARAADVVRPPGRGVTILLYHRVGRLSSATEIDLPTAAFDEQMAWLASTGRVVTLDAAVALLERSEPPDVDPVVVTFDDGTADLVDHVLPVIVRHQVPVTYYVATGFVEGRTPFPADGRPVSWSGLRESLDSGLVAIGSHTHSHALLDRLPADAVDEELDRSIHLIEDRLGVAPVHFAYPKARLGSPVARTAVRRRFRTAVVAGCRPNPYGRTSLQRLQRSPVQVSDHWRWFRHKAQGGLRVEDALRTTANRYRHRGASS